MPYFETGSGSIHYVDQGQGRPLVLLHGWAMSSHVWRYQREDLHEFRIIAPDLPAHGLTTLPLPATVDELAEKVALLLEELDLRGAVLAGWSLGSLVALATARRSTERLAALALVGGTPRFTAAEDYAGGLPPKEVKGMALQLKRAYLKTMEDFFRRMFAPGELDAQAYDAIIQDIAKKAKLPAPETALAALRLLEETDLRPVLPEVGLPVHLLHGLDDTICLPQASRIMAELLPQASLHLLEGVGHAPHLSRRDEFAAFIRKAAAA